MDRLTGSYANRLEEHPADFRRCCIPAAAAPSADHRAQLGARLDELVASLTPTPGPALHRTLTLLLAASREFGRLDPKDVAVRLGLYAEALRDVPVWAVERARLTFGRGGWRCLWDGRDVPSSHDVVAECRHHLLPIETERDRIAAILGAELVDVQGDQAARDREVDRWWGEVRPEIGREPGITQRTDDEISAERADMARSNDRFRQRQAARAAAEGRGQAMWGRLAISDELARQLGLPATEPATVGTGDQLGGVS